MRRFIGIWTLVAVCNRAVHAQGLPSFSLLSPNFLSPQFTKNHNQFIKNGPSSKVYQNSAVVNSVNGCACPGSINGVPPVHVTLCICNNNNNQKHLPDVTVSKKVREEEEVSGESHTVIIPDVAPQDLLKKLENTKVPPSYKIKKDKRHNVKFHYTHHH